MNMERERVRKWILTFSFSLRGCGQYLPYRQVGGGCACRDPFTVACERLFSGYFMIRRWSMCHTKKISYGKRESEALEVGYIRRDETTTRWGVSLFPSASSVQLMSCMESSTAMPYTCWSYMFFFFFFLKKNCN